MAEQRLKIPGSAPKFRAGERWLSPAEANQQVGATIIIRRPNEAASNADLQRQLFSGGSGAVSRAQAEEALRADPADLAAVRSFLEQHGLSITRENAQARTLHVEGTVEQMSRTFGVHLGCFEDAEGNKYLSYEGPLSIPESLSGVITAVLGLDQRPIAKHHAAMGEGLYE